MSQLRKEVAKHIEEIRDHLYEANLTWITSVRKHLRRNLIDSLAEESTNSKSLSFLSFPVPECSCLRSEPSEGSNHASSPPSTPSQFPAGLGVTHPCPSWMNNKTISWPRDKETEEDLDDIDSTSQLFFHSSSKNHEGEGGEINTKEDAQMEDQEELEGGES